MEVAREQRQTAGPRIGARLLWFAVLGGVTAWGVHLLFAWALLELGCLRADPGALVMTLVTLAVIIPLLVALASTVVAFVLRARRRRLQVDEIAAGRVDLLTYVAIYLDLLAVAAIAGGAIALMVLEPC